MTTTVSMLAPAPFSVITSGPGSNVTYTADKASLITGVAVGDILALEAAGCINLGSGVINDASGWNANPSPPQILAAAGATQGNAGKIISNRVIITVTASTEGVIAQAVATGAATDIDVPGTIGAKVYPPLNGKIDAASTNIAVALVAGKGFRLLQRSATLYTLEIKGA